MQLSETQRPMVPFFCSTRYIF